MHTSLRLLLGACALFFTALTGSAQIFVGSDNFDDNLLQLDVAAGEQPDVWSFSLPHAAGAGGAWTETNQRMEYSNATTTGLNRGLLAWVHNSESISAAGGAGLSAGNPYNSSWTTQVSVSDLVNPGAGYTLAGLEIFAEGPGGIRNSYYGIYLATTPGGFANLQVEWGKWNGTDDYNRTAFFASTADTTDVLLRMTYDGSSKVLALDYSFDHGATFLSVPSGETFDLDGAQAGNSAPLDNGIGIDLLGMSNGAGAIAAGQMYFDNFSVSAIPEPSTYAAIAGVCGLGLAAWHRRRKLA